MGSFSEKTQKPENKGYKGDKLGTIGQTLVYSISKQTLTLYWIELHILLFYNYIA